MNIVLALSVLLNFILLLLCGFLIGRDAEKKKGGDR